MIVLHAGLHKTGSTAIQRWLAKAAPAHLGGYRYFGNINRKVADGLLPAELVSQIQRYARTGDLIVSGESLLGNMTSAYANARASAAALARDFGSEGFTVIVYVRPQIGWAEKAYIQQIMQGSDEGPDVFIERLLASPHFAWSKLVTAISDEIGADRLIVRRYSTAVVADFLATIGLGSTAGRVTEPEGVNRSVPASQAALIRAINECRDAGVAQAARRGLQELEWGAADTGGPWSALPEGLQAELMDFTAHDWRKLHAIQGQVFNEASSSFAEGTFRAPPVLPYIGGQDGETEILRQSISVLREALPLAVGDHSEPRSKALRRAKSALLGRVRRRR